MKIPKFYSTSLRVFIICLITGSAKTALAQNQVYFYDYRDSLSISAVKGYILTLQGDTLKGEIRKKRGISDIIFGESNLIRKITFAPDSNKKYKKEYKPGDIKGFGVLSYASQQPIDLTPEYTKSGWIKLSTLKKLFTDPFNRNAAEQFNAKLTHDGMSHYESVTPDSSATPCFFQRLAEGKIIIFNDPSSWELYYNKPDRLNQTGITYVNKVPFWGYKKVFNFLFSDCETTVKLAQQNAEFYKSENFLNIAGFYNMNCNQTSIKLESKSDYVIVSSGGKLEGIIDFKGATFLDEGTFDKISITDTAGKTTNLTAKEIRSFTRYANGLPVTFEHLRSIDADEKHFLHLLSEGKIKLYQNLKGIKILTQSYAEYLKDGVQYILKKEEQEPVAITKTNFEEYFNKLLIESGALKIFTENNPHKKNYDNLPELVKIYNGDRLN